MNVTKRAEKVDENNEAICLASVSFLSYGP